jgi:homoserine/homoserine lactone efflux protein
MDLHLLIGFATATAVLIIVPGPIVMLTIANSLAQGTRAGLVTIAGTSVATSILLVAGGLGLAWVLTSLAAWFDWVRWGGAAYLIYLGGRQWIGRAQELAEHTGARPGHSIFWQGFVVSITNPKTILFYVAFFPQFLDPARPVGPQLLVMSVLFLAIAVLFDGCYAVLAGRLRPWLTGERRGRIRNRVTGSLLIGTGLVLALAR